MINRPIIWIVVIAVLSGCAGIRYDGSFNTSDGDWTTLGGSDERANHTSSDLAPPFRSAWTYSSQGGMLATPLVRDNVLVLATLHGEVQLVALPTGKRLGYITLDGPIRGTPALSGLNVIVPVLSEKESLVYLGLREGRPFWKARTGPVGSSPLLAGEQVIVSTIEGTLVSIAKADGEEVWRFAPGNKEERKPFHSSPALAGENIVCGADDGVLYAVRATDGRPVWSSATGAPIFASPIVVGSAVIVANLDGLVRCLDQGTGEVRWERSLGEPIYATPSSAGSRLLLATAAGEVRALDAATGGDLWRWKAESVVNASPLVSDRYVYVGSLEKRFFVLDISTGAMVWKRDLDGRMKVPAVTWKDYLVLTYEDKTVEALRPEGGQ